MKISEKTIRRDGRTLPVVELVPARLEKTLRWMCGAAGLLLAGAAVAMAMWVPDIAGHDRIKVIILGGIVGAGFVMTAMARRVYRSVDGAGIQVGTRWLGLTHWSPRIPTTHDQVLDIGRNRDSELFLTVRRAEGGMLLAVGPFVDGDQAMKGSALLSPAQNGERSDSSQVDAVRILRQLEGGVPLVVLRVLILVVFVALLVPAWFDRSWIGAVLTLLIGVPILGLVIAWFSPKGGVFYNTDDSKSVEFWTRHRFFRRLEYRKSLVSHDPPEFLRNKLHWAAIGWVLLVPVYVLAVVGLMLR